MENVNLSCLNGLRIVVVEDETLIAMTIEDVLIDIGANVVAVTGTVGDALRAINELQPDAVTLDGNLDGELSGAVAKQLQESGIRHLLVTGYVERSLADPYLAAAPRLNKPFTPASLQQAAAAHLCPPVA